MTTSHDMTADSEQESGLDLNALLAPLARHWKLMLVVPFVAGGLGLGASFAVKPVFSSSTTFLPPQQQQSSAASALASLGSLAGIAGGAAGIKSPADQYVSLMQSVNVSDRLIEQFHLRDVYEVPTRDLARKQLVKHSAIAVGKKDGLITVEVEDTDPQRAADIANQYVAELRRLTSVLAVSEAQQRRVFFEKQLQEAKSRLVSSQTALQESGFNPGAVKAEPKAAAESYARLRAELTTAEVKLQSLRSSLADSATEVRQASSVVQALRDQLRNLEKSEAPATGTGPDYISKYREFKYQETMFEMMARQYELARVDESREGALIQVVDAARPAEHKLRPQRALFAAGAAVAGTLLAALLLLWGARRSTAR